MSSCSFFRDGPLFFIGGLPFLGLADNFFLKNNAFQTIFFITFCNKTTLFTTILENVTGYFMDLN